MATESQFTISPLKRSASARESAVFPLAVGPSTTTSSGSGCAEATVSARSSEWRASTEAWLVRAAEKQSAATQKFPWHRSRADGVCGQSRCGVEYEPRLYCTPRRTRRAVVLHYASSVVHR